MPVSVRGALPRVFLGDDEGLGAAVFEGRVGPVTCAMERWMRVIVTGTHKGGLSTMPT